MTKGIFDLEKGSSLGKRWVSVGQRCFWGDGGGFEANIGRAAVRFIQPGPKESCLTAHTSHAFLHAP